jgi:hypothetical protein
MQLISHLKPFKDIKQSFKPNTLQLQGSSLPVDILGLAISG